LELELEKLNMERVKVTSKLQSAQNHIHH